MNIEQTVEDKFQKIRSQSTACIVDMKKMEYGDRLTRQEFERRYDAMPHIKKAELIEGVEKP